MAVLTSRLIVELLDRVSGPAAKAGAALRGLYATARRSDRAPFADRLGAAMERNQRAIERTRARLIDAAAGFYALKNGLAAPLTKATDFETILEDIGQKAEIPQERLAALGARLRGIGREVNQAGSEIAKGMDILLGMGAKEDVAAGLLQPIGRAATAYRAAVDDLSKAGFATVDNLKVTVAEFPKALDAMARAGKEGAFELRDMATYFPALTAGYAGLKQTGVPAVADLAAALQVVRKGAADSSSAATNLRNIIQKIYAPGTIKKFKELGVDVRKEMAKLIKSGQTPIEAIANLVNKTLKGDLSRLGELFEDAQVQEGLRPLIQNMEEYRRIRAEAMKAQGVVEEDYQRRLQTSGAALMRFRATIENLAISVGAALLPALNRIGDAVLPIVNQISAWAEAYPKLTAGIVGTAAALIGLRVAAIGARYAWSFMALGALGAASAAVKAGGAVVRSMRATRVAAVAEAAATAVAAKASTRRTTNAAVAAAAANKRMVAGMGRTAQAAGAAQMAAGAASARMVTGMSRGAVALRGPLEAAASASSRMVSGMSLAGAAAAGGFRARLAAGGAAALSLVRRLGLVQRAATAMRLALIGTGIGAALVALGSAAAYLERNWRGVKAAVEGFGSSFVAQIGPAADATRPLVNAVRELWNVLAGSGSGRPLDLAAWRKWGEEMGRTAATAVKRVIRILEALRTGDFKLALDITIPSAADLGKTIASRLYQNSFLPEATDFGAKLIGMAEGVMSGASKISEAGAAIGRALYDGTAKSLDIFATLPARILPALGDLGTRIGAAFSFEGVSAKITAVVAEVAALPGRITAAIGSINLSAIGQAAIQSLWDGLKSKFEELKAWAAGVGAAIRAAIGQVSLGAVSAPSLPKPAAPATGQNGGASGSWEAPNFAGARAAGGPVRRARTYLVGELGPELFSPTSDGQITSNAHLRRAANDATASGATAAGRQSARTISPTIHIHSTAAIPDPREFARQIQRELQRLEQEEARGAYAHV